MSVIHYDLDHFANFAAICTHLKLNWFGDAIATAELLSISNCAAYNSQYGETAKPSTLDDIERAALDRLARKDFSGNCITSLYNCVTNNGTLYFGELPAGEDFVCLKTVDEINATLKAVQKFTEAESRRIERQTANDAAYADVEPLPVLSPDEIRAKMTELGADRIIYAEYEVNESDSHTDYYGSRTARTVLIGFGTGKRESFKQLRQAAALFPPTADYAPGCDAWTVSAYRDAPDPHRYVEREPLRDDHYRTMEFPTEAAARAYVDDLIKTHPECQADYVGCIGFPRMAQKNGFEVHCESFENRENYSMGGGNYLGRSRYAGWQVRSSSGAWKPMEWFDAPKPFKPPRKSKQVPSPDRETMSTICRDYAANV